jgi:hypothetical protein
MKIALRPFVLTAAVLAVTASFSLPSFAQDVRREDMVTYFQRDRVDANKDGMVSKKEFLDRMSKAGDMHEAEAAPMSAAPSPQARRMKQEMTREQYVEFSRMFGLNIGG